MSGDQLALSAQIEDASLNASAAPQQLWNDGWWLRLCPGKAKRSRSVNAVAVGRRCLEDKLAYAEAVYANAGLPFIFRVTPFTEPQGLDAALAAAGFQRFDDTWVMHAALADVPAAEPLPRGVAEPVPVGHAEFAELVGALRGTPEAQRQHHRQRLEASPVPYRGVVLRDGAGAVLACAQTAQEGSYVGVYDVFTAPAARGQGHARRLCAHLLAEARARGAAHAYLQVDAGNAPALQVYRRLGFGPAYGYHYRARDPSCA